MDFVAPDPQAVKRAERKQYWIAGIVLTLALVGATAISLSLTWHSGQRQDTQGQLQEQGGAKPHIIPQPNSGHKPTGPGDRGGWEQLLTLGLIVGGLLLVGGLVWRGMRRPNSGRQAWLDAAKVEPVPTKVPAGKGPAPRAPPEA